MPSNHILINGAMEYSVSDSKMDDFLLWLKENGRVVDTGIKTEPDEIASEVISYSQTEA